MLHCVRVGKDHIHILFLCAMKCQFCPNTIQTHALYFALSCISLAEKEPLSIAHLMEDLLNFSAMKGNNKKGRSVLHLSHGVVIEHQECICYKKPCCPTLVETKFIFGLEIL